MSNEHVNPENSEGSIGADTLRQTQELEAMRELTRIHEAVDRYTRKSMDEKGFVSLDAIENAVRSAASVKPEGDERIKTEQQTLLMLLGHPGIKDVDRQNIIDQLSKIEAPPQD